MENQLYLNHQKKRRSFYHLIETNAKKMNIRITYYCPYCTSGLIYDPDSTWNERRIIEIHTYDCEHNLMTECKNMDIENADNFIPCNCAVGSDYSSRNSDEESVRELEAMPEEDHQQNRDISNEWFLSDNAFATIDK